MEKKYVMTDETRIIGSGVILHRIKAIRDFGIVKKGDLGGWIEKEDNLSHEGTCWIYNDAIVLGGAQVCDNAHVCGTAKVFGNAIVYETARVYGNAWVYDNAIVRENARVYGNARVCGNAAIRFNAQVFDDALVYDDATVHGNAKVYNQSHIFGYAHVYGNAQIYGNALVCGIPLLHQYATISNTSDYIVMGPIGSRNKYTTFYKNKDGGISVSCGCFDGTLEEFKDRVESVYAETGETPNSLYYKQYKNAIVYVETTMLN